MRFHRQTDLMRERFDQVAGMIQVWEGTVFRATAIDFANRDDLLAGVGSREFGGRWNPPGLFPAVYASLNPETAMAESLANFRRFGIPIAQATPLVLVAVTVKLQRVLDVMRIDVQNSLGITRTKATTPDWTAARDRGEETLTQAIGRIAWERKLEGLQVPSAQYQSGVNLLLFPDNKRRGSSWRIHRARKLPRKGT